ncbi:MAG: regulatory protein GemA [Candidatus Binatus sp.]
MRTDDPRRRVELAAIHVAKKQLRLDDDLYQAIVERVSAKFRATPISSSGQMTPRERKALLEEMRTLGFRRIERPERWEKPLAPGEGQFKKILALWAELGATGTLHDGSEKALRAFVKKMTGLESPRWLTAAQSNKVIEGLKAWLARARHQIASDERSPG